MAILPAIPGITASIVINGEEAPEILDPDEPTKTHPKPKIAEYQAARTNSTYIKAVSDAHYTISLSVGPPIRTNQSGHNRMKFSKIGFNIEIDGVKVWTQKCCRPWFNRDPNEKMWKCLVEGIKVGKGKKCTIREFKFLKVETHSEKTDKAEIERMRQRMQKVGTIEIKVYAENYGKQGGDADDTTGEFLRENAEDVHVHEKSIKGEARDHGTGLKEAIKVPRGEFWKIQKIDGKNYPLAIFRFLYRSEEALKTLLIIPRTPSPSPAPASDNGDQEEDEDDVDALTPAQQRQLQALMMSFTDNISRSRSRGSSSRENGKSQANTTMKKETVSELRKLQRSLGKGRKSGGKSEIIDLTSDHEDEEQDELFVQ